VRDRRDFRDFAPIQGKVHDLSDRGFDLRIAEFRPGRRRCRAGLGGRSALLTRRRIIMVRSLWSRTD